MLGQKLAAFIEAAKLLLDTPVGSVTAITPHDEDDPPAAAEDVFSIDMDNLAGEQQQQQQYASQDEANAAFVIEYSVFVEQVVGHKPQCAGDLYCSMTRVSRQGATCWWMDERHPVAGVLRNSGAICVAQAHHKLAGEVVAFAKEDVESCIVDIAQWFSLV